MASVVTTSVDKARVKSVLPDWFKPETGFQFLYGGDPAVVLGFGAWRKTESIGGLQLYKTKDRPAIGEALFTIEMKPPTLVIGYLYKGEWHMASIEEVIHEAEKDGKTANDVIHRINHEFPLDADRD